jgi:hypothetical protein
LGFGTEGAGVISHLSDLLGVLGGVGHRMKTLQGIKNMPPEAIVADFPNKVANVDQVYGDMLCSALPNVKSL